MDPLYSLDDGVQGLSYLPRFFFPLFMALALLILFWPGAMSNDAFGWLIRARSGILSDVQPVGPSLLWQGLELFYPGPFPFIAFNVMLVVFAADLLLSRIIRPLWLARLWLVLFILFPPVLAIMGVVWRDVTGLGFTLLTFFLVLFFPEKHRKRAGLIALALLTYISAMFRENHAAGIYPFLVVFAWQFLPGSSGRFRRLAASSLIALIFGTVLTLAAMGTKNALVEQLSWSAQAKNHYILARLSDKTDVNLFPPEDYPGITLEKIRQWIREEPESYYRVFWKAYSIGDEPLLPKLENEELNGHLEEAVKTAIRSYPLPYLQIRLEDILKRLKYTDNHKKGIRVSGFANLEGFSKELEINFPVEKPAWSDRVLMEIKRFASFSAMNNPLYILTLGFIASFLSVFLLQNVLRLAVISAFASGALHYLGIIVFGVHYQFYYGYQSIAMGWLAILLFMAGLINRNIQQESRT